MGVHTEQDLAILASLAEYRAISVQQLAILHRRNTRALRRRLQRLCQDGLIHVGSRGLEGARGRPRQILSLTPVATDWLKSEGILAQDVPHDRVGIEGLRCIEHQLLLNEFRLQLLQVPKVNPFLEPQWTASLSRTGGRPSISVSTLGEAPRDAGIRSSLEFEPDGVFQIADAHASKSVLFFLEVDMGTEPLVSNRGPGRGLRQKINAYQECFRQGSYKRYEHLRGIRFRGFRMLLLAKSSSRLASLSKLANDTPPSDFIWLTDRHSMLTKGLWAHIWLRGGQRDSSAHSILGSRCPNPSPQPEDLD